MDHRLKFYSRYTTRDAVDIYGDDYHHRVCVLHKGTVIPEGLELVHYRNGGKAYCLLLSAPCTVRTFNKNAQAFTTQLEEVSSGEFLGRYASPSSPLYETLSYYPTEEDPF